MTAGIQLQLREVMSTGSRWPERQQHPTNTGPRAGATGQTLLSLLMPLRITNVIVHGLTSSVRPVATAPGSVFVRRSSSGNA